jgi:hypothetical protein
MLPPLLPRVSPPSAARHCRRHRRAPPSARSHRRSRLPSSSLDLTRAHTAACCLALLSHSPEPETQWARHRDLTAAARRSHLRPRHHHQSTRGESNRSTASFVCQARPPFAIGEPPPPPRVRVWIPEGICVNQGPSCNESNLSFFGNWSNTLEKA